MALSLRLPLGAAGLAQVLRYSNRPPACPVKSKRRSRNFLWFVLINLCCYFFYKMRVVVVERWGSVSVSGPIWLLVEYGPVSKSWGLYSACFRALFFWFWLSPRSVLQLFGCLGRSGARGSVVSVCSRCRGHLVMLWWVTSCARHLPLAL